MCSLLKLMLGQKKETFQKLLHLNLLHYKFQVQLLFISCLFKTARGKCCKELHLAATLSNAANGLIF
jgi:hypothetical protein